jgi:hypothetical protein
MIKIGNNSRRNSGLGDNTNKDQLLLAELLKKERSNDHSKKVTEVLQTSLPLREKIKHIQELDTLKAKSSNEPGTGVRYLRAPRKPEKREPNTEKTPSQKPQIKKVSGDTEFKKSTQDEFKKIVEKSHRVRRHLKSVIPHQGFFFLFF